MNGAGFHGQRGVAAIEMILAVLVSTALLVMLVCFARLAWYANALNKATHDAARMVANAPPEVLTNAASNAQLFAAAGNMLVDALAASGVNPNIDPSTIVFLCGGAPCVGNIVPQSVTVIARLPVTPNGFGEAYIMDRLATADWNLDTNVTVSYAP
jgi:Flp pilus assembly protein TadG